MQGQRGAIGSIPETFGFEHGSTSSDVANSPSNWLPDYMSLKTTNQEGQNVSMWSVGEPSSSSGPNQPNTGHIEPIPDCVWPSLMKSCPEPPSSVLSLGDHGASSSLFSDSFGPSSDPFDLDDHRMSRKRKAVELTMGQSSSGVGNSNMFQRSEGDLDPIIPRFGLSIGENPPVLNQEIDPLPACNNNNSNNDNNNSNNNRKSDVSGPRLNPPSENPLSLPGQPVLRAPALRRNFQSTSRWSRSSSSRAARSPNPVISVDHSELNSISDHPVHQSNIRLAAQTELDWNSIIDGNVNGIATSSRARPSSGPSPIYNPRRLSAFLRRSLLSAAGSEGGGGHNRNIIPIIPPAGSSSSSSSQDVGTPSGQNSQPYSRSSLLLGRQLEDAFSLPYLSRTMTPGGQGRGRLVSEIRNVLDLMRRGESLRLEELLALEERIGNVNTGLTEETVSKHLKQKPYVVETGRPSAEPCSICQEEYKDGDDLGPLECGHDFHYGCVKQWLQHKNLCPICKSTGFAATSADKGLEGL